MRQSADWEKLASQQSADWEVPNLPFLQSSPIKVSPAGGNWFAKYRPAAAGRHPLFLLIICSRVPPCVTLKASCQCHHCVKNLGITFLEKIQMRINSQSSRLVICLQEKLTQCSPKIGKPSQASIKSSCCVMFSYVGSQELCFLTSTFSKKVSKYRRLLGANV